MDNNRLVAYAQIILSAIFIAGYFAVLFTFLSGKVNVDLAWKEAIIALFGVITAGVGVILAYWFARQRPNS